MKAHALVTNDDGIESAFLNELVEALLVDFRVSVAAPESEQSWKGRSMTRHGKVKVTQIQDQFPESVEAWAIDGTPSDCVNIALGNLLPELPDIVLSGINIGYNTTETLILSSGTVAGAIEGSLWGIPSIAFSKCVPHDIFDSVQKNKGQADNAFTQSLKAAADHARQIAKELLVGPLPEGKIVNVNFPAKTAPETSIAETYPAKLKLGSLFGETSAGVYEFRYSDGIVVNSEADTDRAALESGLISRSTLDFSKAGR